MTWSRNRPTNLVRGCRGEAEDTIDGHTHVESQQDAVFLNPDARVSFDKKSAGLTYPTAPASLSSTKNNTKDETRQMVEQLAKASAGSGTKVGVDVESIDAINIDNETFVERNFTPKEQQYCRQAPSPQASFAGRWSAKEAVFKSLGVAGKGAGAGMKEIEIVNDDKGAPVVEVSFGPAVFPLTIKLHLTSSHHTRPYILILSCPVQISLDSFPHPNFRGKRCDETHKLTYNW